MCLSSACDDANGKTWCQSARNRVCFVLPHNGVDEYKMYLTYTDVSHELIPSYQLAFTERLHAIVRTAVPVRSKHLL